MADRWVINASPIILLAKAEVIQFLPELCETLIVPAGVLSEVHNIHISDAGKVWLESQGNKLVRDSPALHPIVAAWQGGAGEAEVISWALQNPGSPQYWMTAAPARLPRATLYQFSDGCESSFWLKNGALFRKQKPHWNDCGEQARTLRTN